MNNEATFREVGDVGRSISQIEISLNILVHVMINVLYYNTEQTSKTKILHKY